MTDSPLFLSKKKKKRKSQQVEKPSAIKAGWPDWSNIVAVVMMPTARAHPLHPNLKQPE